MRCDDMRRIERESSLTRSRASNGVASERSRRCREGLEPRQIPAGQRALAFLGLVLQLLDVLFGLAFIVGRPQACVCVRGVELVVFESCDRLQHFFGGCILRWENCACVCVCVCVCVR